jgi:hypothetical protein
MRTITAYVLAAVLAAMLGAPAQAQVLFGSLFGQVAEASSAVAPGATVRITHRETNQQRVATTNAGPGRKRYCHRVSAQPPLAP